MTQTTIDTARLDREIEHFDRHYAREAAAGVEPLSASDCVRYVDPPATTVFPREYYFHLLAPLQGRAVLEIACGNGIDACIAARQGATVFAYDVSPQAVDMLRRRAEANGVGDRVHTQVTGDLDAAFGGRTFDAIMGYAALHHLPRAGLARRVHDRLAPGGVAVFAEPTSNSPALRRLRQLVPYAIDAMSDDEAPLTDADIVAFADPFKRTARRDFQLTSRIWRLWPDNARLAEALHRLDRQVLRFPFMRRFATVAVFGLYRD